MKISKKFLIVLSLLLLALIIGLSPWLDNSIANLPFNKANNSFYGESSLFSKVVYHLVPWITGFMVVIPLGWLAFAKLKQNNHQIKSAKRFSLIVLLSLAIGPGLLVNAILKEHWGRARPYQVLRDNKEFSPVWHADFKQNTQHSFSSGHASIGFFLGVPFFVLGRKKLGLLLSGLGGAVVGVVRILQGGHYLTDVIFSGLFVWLTVLCITYVVDRYYIKGYK